MFETRIPFNRHFGVSPFYLDYLDKAPQIDRFFAPIPLAERARAIASRHYPRQEMIDILLRQNTHWGAPQVVLDNINKLTSETCLTVCTGQQACLFGGAYMIILKALGAVKKAHQLEEQLSVPVVPLFWISADDHDFREISFVDLFDAQGQLTRLNIDIPEGDLFPPVGRLTYDLTLDRELAHLRELLPENDFKAAALAPVEHHFCPGASIVDSFAAYLHHLIGRFGIVLFNPHDSQVKQLAAPIMQKIIRQHGEVKSALNSAAELLAGHGYALQVQKSPTAAHLFAHLPERVPVHADGERFKAGEMTYSAAELASAIDEHPLDFSPDVLTRPVVQSHLFPTVATIGGPAETAYFAQLMPLFPLFGLTEPMVLSRPSGTLVEKKFEKLMARHDLSFVELLTDIEAVINRLFHDTFPIATDEKFADLALQIQAGIADLQDRLIVLDPNLRDTIRQTGEKMDYQLQELKKKAFAAHKKRSAADREQMYRLYHNLFPNRMPAERSIAPLYFISRYGEGVIDFIFENLQPDETHHQLLLLSGYYGQT